MASFLGVFPHLFCQHYIPEYNGRKWRQSYTPTGEYYVTHSMQVQDDVLYKARRCNNFEFTIHLMIVGLLRTALSQYLKCQDQQISKIVEALSYSAVHEISEGAPFFYLACQGGAARTPAPVSYATVSDT